LAGLVRRTELSSDLLPADEAAKLDDLIADAGLRTAPETPPPPPAHADEMSYKVRLEDEGETRTLSFTDSTLPESVRSLIAWIDARPERNDSLARPGGP
jgi:hypothetical protein